MTTPRTKFGKATTALLWLAALGVLAENIVLVRENRHLREAAADTDGFVEIVADAKTDRVLGCHMIGPDAGTLIHEVVMAIEFGGSAEDIARTCHGHPTLNEAVKEAALGVAGRAIHI